MGIVGRLDQYASMLAGEFDDYSMSENLMTNSQLGTTILNDGGAVTLSTDTSIINPFSGYDGVLKCVHTTNTGGYFRRGQNMSLTAGVTYTFSVFFKNGTVANPYGVANPNTGPGLQVTTFTPTFQELNTSLNTNIPFPNGWYRQVFTFTPSYNQTYQVDFNQAVNQTPIGTYYLYGFQLENGSVATDYTPTTTTAKNRVLPSTTNTNITGLSTYFGSGFSENIGAASTLVANVFPPYDPVYDDFGGTLFGAGQGRYMRQNTDKSVIVYNEIDEVSDFYSRGVVRAGLVLDLDAGIDSSYPGTGTTWTDLSPYGNNGELVNSPTYNSSNSGYFQFVTDDFARMQNNTALDTQTPSVEVWVKTNATTQNGFWFEKGEVNTQYSLFQEGSSIQWRMNIGGITNLSTTTATYMNTTSWYQIVGTYTSGSRKLYINGTLVNSDGQTGTIATNSGGMSIGVYGGYAGGRGYYYNGNLAICRVYNRVLTAAEIKQNYDATKGRFGL